MMEELEIYKSATGRKQTLLSSRWPAAAAGSLAAEAGRERCAAWSSFLAALAACARLQLQQPHLQLGGLWGSVVAGPVPAPPSHSHPRTPRRRSWRCAFPPGALME